MNQVTGRCNRTPIFGGPRIGPSIDSGAYHLVLNGDEELFRAHVQVTVWPDAIFRASQALAARMPS